MRIALLIVVGASSVLPVAHADDFCQDIEQFLPRLAEAQGQLRVEVAPGWGKVYVDASFVGVTPMEPVDLEVGDHCVEIVHPDGEPRLTRHVNIKAGKLQVLSINFNAKDKGPNCTPWKDETPEKMRVRTRTNMRKDTTWYEVVEPVLARSLCEEGNKRARPPLRLDEPQEALLCGRRSGLDVLLSGSVPAYVVDVWIDGQITADADGAYYANVDGKKSRIVFDMNGGMWIVRVDTTSIGELVSCVRLHRTVTASSLGASESGP